MIENSSTVMSLFVPDSTPGRSISASKLKVLPATAAATNKDLGVDLDLGVEIMNNELMLFYFYGKVSKYNITVSLKP